MTENNHIITNIESSKVRGAATASVSARISRIPHLSNRTAGGSRMAAPYQNQQLPGFGENEVQGNNDIYENDGGISISNIHNNEGRK